MEGEGEEDYGTRGRYEEGLDGWVEDGLGGMRDGRDGRDGWEGWGRCGADGRDGVRMGGTDEQSVEKEGIFPGLPPLYGDSRMSTLVGGYGAARRYEAMGRRLC